LLFPFPVGISQKAFPPSYADDALSDFVVSAEITVFDIRHESFGHGFGGLPEFHFRETLLSRRKTILPVLIRMVSVGTVVELDQAQKFAQADSPILGIVVRTVGRTVPVTISGSASSTTKKIASRPTVAPTNE